MSKKIDIKRTLGQPNPPLSIEAIEEMTQMIHGKKEATQFTPPADPHAETHTPKVKNTPTKTKTEPKYEETTATFTPEEKGKRGRKPKMIMEQERLLRVSVDLPESVFIQLKVHVIQQKTDMKAYVRKLVEREMTKMGK